MMIYNLMFVDVGYRDYDPTYIHRMNVITGDYLPPIVTKDYWDKQVEILCEAIRTDKPQKIIFNKLGHGNPFYDIFINHADRYYYEVFEIDAFGLITFKES